MWETAISYSHSPRVIYHANALTLALLPALPLLMALGALAVPLLAVFEFAPELEELAALPSPYLLSSNVTNGFVVLLE